MNTPISTGALVGIAAGILLVLLFLGVVFLILRRESARSSSRKSERVAAPRRARSVPSAWEGADVARGARDTPKPRPAVETDLPPITMNTTDWGVGTVEPVMTQSSLIAAPAAPQDADGVYRTGFNPFYKSTSHIQVEEVADLVQQAELMVTLENIPVAISMLP